MKTPVSVKVLVSGRVQGVYYRVFAERRAKELKLTGYTRNLKDLTVEVFAEGEREKLDRLIASLRQGPPGARVDDLNITWSEGPPRFTDFLIVP